MKKSATIIPCRKKDCPSKPASEKKWCLIDSNDVAKRCAPTKQQCKDQEKNINYFKHNGATSPMKKRTAAEDPFATLVANSLKKLNVAEQLATVANYLTHWKDAPKLETPEGQKAFAAFLKAVPALAVLQQWQQGLQKQLGAPPKTASRKVTARTALTSLVSNIIQQMEELDANDLPDDVWEDAKYRALNLLRNWPKQDLLNWVEEVITGVSSNDWKAVLRFLKPYDEDYFQGGVSGVLVGILADVIADEVVLQLSKE